MVGFNPQQQFPGISAPLVEVELPDGQVAFGRINQIWLQLLIALWKRTGSGPGSVSTDGLLINALSNSADYTQDNSLALMALLSAPLTDGGGGEDKCACCTTVLDYAYGTTIDDRVACGTLFTNAA